LSVAQILTHTASDGYVWQYRRHEPNTPPRGHLIALHGIQSHSGWYETSSQWLAENGWKVSFLDRRGCGLNKNARGDCPSFRRLLDDIAEFVGSLRQSGAKPIVLMAISWGGKLGIALQKRHPGLCDGLILMTPGIKPEVRPKLLTRLVIGLVRFVSPTRMYPIPLNDPELFTGNPERQQFIAADQSALQLATARLLVESRRLDFYLRPAARHVRIPTLLVLAGRDRIINNDRTRRFARRLRHAELEVIEYAKAHHTLEFEPDGPPFFDDLNRWLNQFNVGTSL
jgi:alpha-beta hydrolase superfamily lysophospholipase